jgi:hypothetical protein
MVHVSFFLPGAANNTRASQVLEANTRLALPLSAPSPIGVVLIACTFIYLILRTSILGAILQTGYLGGAVATNVRADSGWFKTIFPALFAALVWVRVALRNHRLWILLIGDQPTLVAHN